MRDNNLDTEVVGSVEATSIEEGRSGSIVCNDPFRDRINCRIGSGSALVGWTKSNSASMIAFAVPELSLKRRAQSTKSVPEHAVGVVPAPPCGKNPVCLYCSRSKRHSTKFLDISCAFGFHGTKGNFNDGVCATTFAVENFHVVFLSTDHGPHYAAPPQERNTRIACDVVKSRVLGGHPLPYEFDAGLENQTVVKQLQEQRMTESVLDVSHRVC